MNAEILEPRESLWQKLGRCYPLSLELVPLLLLALAVYWVASNYSALPTVIPTHFGAQGRVDGWGGKSTLLILPAVSVGVYVLLTAIGAAMSLVEDPRSLINLPAKSKAVLTNTEAEELRVFVVRSLLVTKTLTVGVMVYLVSATIEVARGQAEGLGTWFYVLVGAILVCAAYMTWRSLSLTLCRRA